MRERPVREGTLVVGPPGTEHAIRNTGSGLLVYVSATAPPIAASITGHGWEPRDLVRITMARHGLGRCQVLGLPAEPAGGTTATIIVPARPEQRR